MVGFDCRYVIYLQLLAVLLYDFLQRSSSRQCSSPSSLQYTQSLASCRISRASFKCVVCITRLCIQPDHYIVDHWRIYDARKSSDKHVFHALRLQHPQSSSWAHQRSQNGGPILDDFRPVLPLLKGQYTKLPPRVTFAVQAAGTVVVRNSWSRRPGPWSH